MLTTKQKAFLRSLAQTERAMIQVGKDAISDNLINNINELIKKRELLKISVLKNCPMDIKECAFDLARLTNSELVQVIGRQVIIYKKAKEPKILLP